MTAFVISDPDKPWVVLFYSLRLDALAEAIAAQPPPRQVSIYASLDGHSRPLDPDERIVLFQRVLELLPRDEHATAEIAAARADAATTLAEPRDGRALKVAAAARHEARGGRRERKRRGLLSALARKFGATWA